MRGLGRRRIGRLAGGSAWSAALLALAGCAGLDMQAADGPCLDDSQACIAQRTALVRSMSADPSHGWIAVTPGRSTVASGVRLFAYQNVRDKLSCTELAAALSDLDAARHLLAQGPAAGQSQARHNEIKAMTEDVRGSIAASRQRKCVSA